MDSKVTNLVTLRTQGHALFQLYAVGVGGTTHDGKKLTWDMIGDRQKAGWDRAARLFAQGLRAGSAFDVSLLPEESLLVSMRAMLQNQLELNTNAYASDWLVKGKNRDWIYPVAASQEIAEFIDSLWQPWWSGKNKVDTVNQRMELVDAWHFILSELLIYFDGDIDTAALSAAMAYEGAQADIINDDGAGDPLHNARLLQAMLSSFNPGDDIEELGVYHFFLLCDSIGFQLPALQSLYIGKAVLNQFRKDNGYKADQYVKLWDGKNQDNFFLAQWVDARTAAGETPTKQDTLDYLVSAYANVLYSQTATDSGARAAASPAVVAVLNA